MGRKLKSNPKKAEMECVKLANEGRASWTLTRYEGLPFTGDTFFNNKIREQNGFVVIDESDESGFLARAIFFSSLTNYSYLGTRI